jgi:MFS family permease
MKGKMYMEKLSTTKLNYKRTLLVGFAFFLIIAFWQAYDNIIPKILTDKFGLSHTWSGAIMALDNLLAVFLLPIFGSLSDKCKSKRGRRTPFIVIGTLLAVVLFVSLSFVDQMQLSKLKSVSEIDNREALEEIYDSESDRVTYLVNGEKKTLRDLFDREQFASIRSADENGNANPDYNEYVVPARQSYAWQKTVASPVTIIFFVLILFGILLSMGIFRSPAVALMPDVTPKPLRSKANAIINLMGSIGGVLVLVLGMIFGTGKAENVLMSYLPFFVAVAAIMMVSLLIFIFTVKEPRWSAEADAVNSDFSDEEPAETSAGARNIKKKELISLILILASVALWYMGYNAVTSKYSVYAGDVLNLDYNLTLLIAQAAAIVSYLPIGILSSKLGRKKTILAGVLILAASFGGAAFLRAGSPAIIMNILFVLAGIGWATINVNSYPMVVELARGGDVGKYTGFYYTASMAAQILTPILSGVFIDLIDMTALFPYATIFVVLSFVTMLFVRHGDVKPKAPKSNLEALGEND